MQAGACLHGLARLVEAVLGRRLDKSWQVTNWEQRPLHPAQVCASGTAPKARPTPSDTPLHTQVRYAAADAYVVVELAQALLPAAAGPRWAQARPCMRALRADGSLAVPQPAEWCAFAGAEEGAAAVAYCSAEARRSAASVPRWEEMVPPRSRPAVGRVIRAVRAMPRAARLRDEGLVLPCAGPGSGEVVCLLDAEARGAGSVPAVSRALGVAPSSLLKTVLCAARTRARSCPQSLTRSVPPLHDRMECRDGEDAGAGRRAVMVALPLHRRIESVRFPEQYPLDSSWRCMPFLAHALSFPREGPSGPSAARPGARCALAGGGARADGLCRVRVGAGGDSLRGLGVAAGGGVVDRRPCPRRGGHGGRRAGGWRCEHPPSPFIASSPV